jgi:hypothetical protein
MLKQIANFLQNALQCCKELMNMKRTEKANYWIGVFIFLCIFVNSGINLLQLSQRVIRFEQEKLDTFFLKRSLNLYP